MADTLVGRNHKVSSESWDGIHTKHYPMHYNLLLGWRYYENRNAEDGSGRLYFLFEDGAVRNLKGKIERGQ